MNCHSKIWKQKWTQVEEETKKHGLLVTWNVHERILDITGSRALETRGYNYYKIKAHARVVGEWQKTELKSSKWKKLKYEETFYGGVRGGGGSFSMCGSQVQLLPRPWSPIKSVTSRMAPTRATSVAAKASFTIQRAVMSHYSSYIIISPLKQDWIIGAQERFRLSPSPIPNIYNLLIAVLSDPRRHMKNMFRWRESYTEKKFDVSTWLADEQVHACEC